MKQADQALYNQAAFAASAAVTHRYTTSFGWAIRLLPRRQKQALYGLYGFVRLADELVDSYPAPAAGELLKRLRYELKASDLLSVSVNPIIQSYITVRREYEIDNHLTQAFLESMEMDLTQRTYSQEEYERYIYGSAEVVGLMCLRVFVDKATYQELSPAARRLGSAMQKVNFLRDFASDYEDRERIYFPGITYKNFNDARKEQIEKDILADFAASLNGLNRLPYRSRIAVAVAYSYYIALLHKIQATPAQTLKRRRVRVANGHKLLIALRVLVRQGLLRQAL